MKNFGKLVLVFFVIFISKSHASFNLISHAGGELDSFLYTNSEEALEQSLFRNFKYIEIDLQLTEDNFFFGLHDWSDLEKIEYLNKNILQLKEKYDKINLKLEDIKNFNNKSKFKIITEDALINFFNNNKNLVLITDKTQNFQKLEKLTSELNSKVFVEVKGKLNFILSFFYKLDKRIFYTDLNRVDKLFIKLLNIKDIVISKDLLNYQINKKFIKNLIQYNDINLYLFTINDEEELKKFNFNKDIFVYTDYLKPEL